MADWYEEREKRRRDLFQRRRARNRIRAGFFAEQREKAGLTRAEFARLANTSYAAVYAVESGNGGISDARLEQWLSVLERVVNDGPNGT